MNPLDSPMEAALAAALRRVITTADAAAEQVTVNLGAQGQSPVRTPDREVAMSLYMELRRKMATMQAVFSDVLTTKVRDETKSLNPVKRKVEATNWQSLSLVADTEIEDRMVAERIGQQISHVCEAELRELVAYMGAVLGLGRADEARNPLRPDLIGAASHRAIEAVTQDRDARKLLARDFGQAMALAMPECYRTIVADLVARGVQPVNMSLKTVDGPGNQLPGYNSGYAGLRDDFRSTNSGGLAGLESQWQDTPSASTSSAKLGVDGNHAGARNQGRPQTGAQFGAQFASQGSNAAANSTLGKSGLSTRGGVSSGSSALPGSRSSHGADVVGRNGPAHSVHTDTASASDAQLMSLLRRLTFLASRPADLDYEERRTGGRFGHSGSQHHNSGGGGNGNGSGSGSGFLSSSRPAPMASRHGTSSWDTQGLSAAVAGARSGDAMNEAINQANASGLRTRAERRSGLMAENLIRAHRDELQQASSGKLDHMVIDVVGSLFDQILSDSRVPPQMARQIARLQLPVLRVALMDASFFSSRRHPVRRFVNRIASLACAFDDFNEGPGKQFLLRVNELVKEIVDGDFDQVEVYAAKLEAIEAFISSQTQGEAKSTGAASLLEGKESELRIQQRYMLQLQQALQPVALQGYLRDFLAQVWSQALVLTARSDGADAASTKRLRQVAVELVMSVQPKGSLPMRKRFLMQLPGLMKDLNQGLKLIGWPDAAQKTFFGQLLPSHAESLKVPAISELDHNMLVKQLEAIFALAIPRTEDLLRSDPLPVLEELQIEQRFSAAELKQIGLVEESTVDWSTKLDIDLSADAMEPAAGVPVDVAMVNAGSGPASVPGSFNSAALLGVDINLELAVADPAIASHGLALMEHVRVGFAYQMHLKDAWQKVRLNYVSPARSFFVFTRGQKHQETISLTSRMLARMCDSGRMRAVESTYLMERATARARKQLAAMKAQGKLN